MTFFLGIVVAAILLGALLLGFVLLNARAKQARARRPPTLLQALRDYVEGRGAEIEFDKTGFYVRGALGEGREELSTLAELCKPGDEPRWEKALSTYLIKYVPDRALELRMTPASNLARFGGQIAALSDAELRAGLRVAIVRVAQPTGGLALIGRSMSDDLAARVIVEDFELIPGLPEQARARLSESDSALWELALAASLPEEVPEPSAGECDSYRWLLEPEAVWGDQPHLIVAVARGLAWTPAVPGDLERRLLELIRKGRETGPLTSWLWAWDGRSLSCSLIVVHTIMGPNTPDFTLTLPPAFGRSLGLQPDAQGRFGVSWRNVRR
ncbi:MAG: hypothetical protein R3B09_28795 [Nannocystaceae bacterium]